MDKAEQTMIDNILKNTGKSVEEWIDIIINEKFQKHNEIINFLKDKHAFTYGFANYIAHKSKKSDAGSTENKEDLISEQYKGKEHFKPLYEQLSVIVQSFGTDISFEPKKTYVSVRRKKQFAMLQPTSKVKYDIGINLKNQETSGKLVKVTSTNSMCSHKITISTQNDIDEEVRSWLKKAYENAG